MNKNVALSCGVCSFEFGELSAITLAEKTPHSFRKLRDTNVDAENLKFKLESDKVYLCEVCSLEICELSSEEGYHSYKHCDKKVAEENLIAKCSNWVKESELILASNYPSDQSVNSNKPLQNLKKELNRLENLFSIQTDEISKLMLEVSIRLEVTRKNFSKLQEIKNNKEINNEMKLEKLISKMKNDYKETQKILGFNLNMLEETLRSTNSFENFDQIDEFIQNIFHKLLNYEEIFSVCESGNETKSGKISIQENFLFFHALDSSRVPRKASIINFEEVKQFLQTKRCRIFITISLKRNKTSMIIIEMLKTRHSNKVLGLCLGEFGSSYKNAVQIGYSNNFMLMDIILEQESSTFHYSSVDYFCPQNNEDLPQSLVSILPNSVLAQEILNDGSFSLITKSSVKGLDENTFGVVIYPSNIRELLSSEKIPTVSILDCGIALNVSV